MIKNPIYSCKIVWLTPEEGGRKSGPPPLEYNYCATADINGRYWSFRFTERKQVEEFNTEKAKIQFLVEDAYQDLEKYPCRITEGAKTVAWCNIEV